MDTERLRGRPLEAGTKEVFGAGGRYPEPVVSGVFFGMQTGSTVIFDSKRGGQVTGRIMWEPAMKTVGGGAKDKK